jgi:hypothetical protein
MGMTEEGVASPERVDNAVALGLPPTRSGESPARDFTTGVESDITNWS